MGEERGCWGPVFWSRKKEARHACEGRAGDRDVAVSYWEARSAPRHHRCRRLRKIAKNTFLAAGLPTVPEDGDGEEGG